ncbi:transcription factor IIIB 90 kDa subunit-like [Solea senegalensis]|uniref:Transcription factor IIIB 90 kDa subunit-like n=1 Tax=Solea senegalensis TaxID=28829 RepID=A0AAV6S0B9_SOLSE|nr:transcription factor IIIB 90 kDa subunit-like [Solea senegalensis]
MFIVVKTETFVFIYHIFNHVFVPKKHLNCFLSSDPCLYIPRFAQKLEFGEKNHEVSMTALRLVQRMKRDWMHTGRRPSGLCGAALLVAARMYDFCRTTKEIVKVVKVCESTLRKRLTEFQDTPSGQLTIEEFMRLDLDQECDPPCYTTGLKNKKYQQLEIELEKKMEDFEEEIHCYEDEIDAELQNCRPKLRGVYAAYTKETATEVPEEVGDDDDVSTPSKMSAATDEEREEEDELEAVAKHFGKEMSELTLEALIKLEQKAPEDEEEEEEEGGSPKRKGPTLESILGRMPTASTLGLPESISKCFGEEKENDGAADSGELDLSGIDDKEIELYLLDDGEVKVKTALWMAENSDYLKQLKEKEAKIAKEKELGIYKERKPRGPSKKRPPIRANTADEAIEKMLEQKKISSKINYDVLKDLNVKPGSSPARQPDTPKREASAVKLTGRNRSSPRAPLSLSTPLSTLGKRLQPFITGLPKKKMAMEQAAAHNPLPVPVGNPDSGVVVESGPVVYDDAAEEEEDEEEETCVSAMELLGSNDYGSDADYDDGF